jgi:PhnB protein
MTARINPYIIFAGNAREAMEFYRDALGGELTVNTFGEFGDTGPTSDQVMHAQLETPDDFVLMASDTPPGMESPSGSSISVSIFGDERDKLSGFFEKLSAGGEVTMPLEKQMWGDEYGQFTDKFGVSWMVNIADPGRS